MAVVLCLTSSPMEAEQVYSTRTLIGGRMIVVTGDTPEAVTRFDGIRFTEDDMVCEFPGFRDGEHAGAIIGRLHRSIAKADNAGPQWIQITGSRGT